MVALADPPLESDAVRVIEPAVERVNVVVVPVCGLTEPEPEPLIFHATVPLLPEAVNRRLPPTATVALEGDRLRLPLLPPLFSLPGILAFA